MACPSDSRVPLNMRPGATWTDQVLRQQAFQAAHPEVTIMKGNVPLDPAPAGW